MDYFRDIQKMSIRDLIIDSDMIYAHIDYNERKETLEEHSNLCIGYLETILSKKQLENTLVNFEDRLLINKSEEGKKFFREMLYHTIYLHDVGKINCNFQYIKMNNTYFKNKHNIDVNNSNHSMLSALIYINEFFSKIGNLKQREEQIRFCIILIINSYVISKHHGELDSLDAFKRKLMDKGEEGYRLYTEEKVLYYTNYTKDILGKNPQGKLIKLIELVNAGLKEWFNKENKETADLYVYTRFLSSLLLSCDYYATTEYMNKSAIKDFGEIQDIYKFYDIYKESKVYRMIRCYEEEEYHKNHSFDNISDINILRNELFLDAEKNLLNNLNKNIFYLEAPTGAGKSMVSFNLAFRLVEQVPNINKIFYVYPFNTLIEQNMDNLAKLFAGKDVLSQIAVVNSLVPIKQLQDKKQSMEKGEATDFDNIDYAKSLLDRLFLHYPIILTTHVSMFRFLFGAGKEDLFPLSQIANSVIILDEIQSYKNSIWKEIITFINIYSDLLNIKVIIMSATLPNLSNLVDAKVNAINLIENKNKYFKNPIFKDRVKLDFSLLDVKEEVMDKLIEHIVKKAKKDNINILIEFIYRSSADEAYERLYNLDINGKEILLLTGETSPFERKEIVKAFKERKNIILVSTQVIEAGIDIDADVGYKDISLLDSEEQFIGRINRNFSNKHNIGIVYFFNLNSAAELYRGDVRKETIYTLVNKDIQTLLINKEFDSYYEKVLSYLQKRAYSSDGFHDFFKNNVCKLDYSTVQKKMNLIDEQYQFSVFFNRDIDIGNGKILNGEEVWNTYLNLLYDTKMDYAERRIKLHEVSIKLNLFIYKTRKNDFPYEKHVGDLYYISDGDKYFEKGRFLRKYFDNDIFL